MDKDVDWRTLSINTPATSDAAAVKGHLLLQNAPNAVVRWKAITFKPGRKPGRLEIAGRYRKVYLPRKEIEASVTAG